ELPLDLGAGLLVLGGLECGLEFLQALVQVGLPPGQLLEPAEDLAGLALLPVALRLALLLRSGGALVLVAALLAGERELVALLSRGFPPPAARVPAVAAVVTDALELAGPEFQERLVGGLLGGGGGGEGSDARRRARLGQAGLGVLHRACREV